MKTEHVDTDALKAKIAGQEESILAALGIDPCAGRQHQQCPYPDHDDRHPSWRWDEKKKCALCSCIQGSCDDIFEVIKKMRGCDFVEAKLFAAGIVAPQLICERGEASAAPLPPCDPHPPSDRALAGGAVGHSTTCETPQSSSETASRSKYAWSDCEAALRDFFSWPHASEDTETLSVLDKEYGINRDTIPDTWRVYAAAAGPGIVYVGQGPKGEVMFKYRSLSRDSRGKRANRVLYREGGHLADAGPPAIFFGQPDFEKSGPKQTPLVIVGGEEKAAVAHQADYSAFCPILGESVLHKNWCNWAVSHQFPKIIIAHDNDKAGAKANQATAEALEQAGYPAEQIRIVEWPSDVKSGFDLNDLAKRGGTEAVRAALESAPAFQPRKIERADQGDQSGSDLLPIWTAEGKLIPLNVARNIQLDCRLIHTGGFIHEYEGGVYRRRDDFRYERTVIQMIGPSVRRNHLAEVVKLLEVETAIEPDAVQRSGRIINLKNGLLDLDKDLLPHSPDFISTSQIPITFDPNAECPTWLRCLDEWFPNEPKVVELLQEWFGYCLVPDTRQHKALIMLGEGANGKSVCCDVLKSLVGDENVSAVSINSLSRTFALAELHGKLLNLSVEAEVKSTIEEGNFKQIVAGDPIQAERKFKDPFVFHPFARFTIATNNLFHVDDKSEGFYRRLLIVRFERTFAEGEQDRELSAKLQAELPGIFNWAHVGLKHLEERGRFQIPKRVQEEVAEYRRHNNPVMNWADDYCELDPDAWTPFKELYQLYRGWADDNGHRPMASNKFSMELKRLPGVVPEQNPSSKKRTRGYRGIRISWTIPDQADQAR